MTGADWTSADGRVRLVCGDCRDVLPVECDAVVTDPPYGIKIARRGTLGSENAAPVRDYGKSDWDDAPPTKATLDMIRGLGKQVVIFGGNFFELPPSSCWLVWDKKTTGDYADCELAWTNQPKAVRRIEWLWNGMIRKGNDDRVHPTQKPVGVMAWCMETVGVPEGGTVLDPFMGSGSTGVACIRTGRKFIGIEKDARYFEIARARLENELRQGLLPLTHNSRDRLAAEIARLRPSPEEPADE